MWEEGNESNYFVLRHTEFRRLPYFTVASSSLLSFLHLTFYSQSQVYLISFQIIMVEFNHSDKYQTTMMHVPTKHTMQQCPSSTVCSNNAEKNFSPHQTKQQLDAKMMQETKSSSQYKRCWCIKAGFKHLMLLRLRSLIIFIHSQKLPINL